MFDKSEKKNEIIEKLIKHFDHYTKNFKEKLKVNSLFNDLEDKVREDLLNLV